MPKAKDTEYQDHTATAEKTEYHDRTAVAEKAEYTDEKTAGFLFVRNPCNK